MEQELKQLEKDLLASAETLQRERHQIANALESEIKTELCDLYMDKADFKVVFTKGKFTVMVMSKLSFIFQPIQVKDLNRLLRLHLVANCLDLC